MCGIFGIINNKKSKFDRTAFNIMGVCNDSRGGDSVGIYIDGQLEYGIQQKAKYAVFFQESKLVNETKDCKAAIGHCRKASIGMINLENAHPINIYEDGKLVFSFVHNGTIYNYEELAKKYIPNVDIKGFTDSKTLAYIIYNKQYGALAEYNGGAAFCAIDVKNQHYLFYKGASKYYKTSTEETVERPLYCLQEKDRFVFSSIKESLMIFSKEEVREFENNVLYCLNRRGTLSIMRTIDRSNAVQSKPIMNTSYLSNTYNFPERAWGYGNVKSLDFAYKVQRCSLFNSQRVGRFERNFKLLDGEIPLWSTGYESEYGTEFCFYDGYLLYNNQCLYFLDMMEETDSDGYYISPELFQKIVELFSFYPYIKKDGFWYKRKSLTEEYRYTGNLPELFSDDTLMYKEGLEVMKVSGKSCYENYQKVLEKMREFHFDENDLFSEVLLLQDLEQNEKTDNKNGNTDKNNKA